ARRNVLPSLASSDQIFANLLAEEKPATILCGPEQETRTCAIGDLAAWDGRSARLDMGCGGWGGGPGPRMRNRLTRCSARSIWVATFLTPRGLTARGTASNCWGEFSARMKANPMLAVLTKSCTAPQKFRL